MIREKCEAHKMREIAQKTIENICMILRSLQGGVKRFLGYLRGSILETVFMKEFWGEVKKGYLTALKEVLMGVKGVFNDIVNWIRKILEVANTQKQDQHLHPHEIPSPYRYFLEFDIVIQRDESTQRQTMGNLYIKGKEGGLLYFSTLELPWKNNERNVSRIPAGEYMAKEYFSPKLKQRVLLILEVPNREWIEIHPATRHENLQGCIGVGRNLQNVIGDEELDLVDKDGIMEEIFQNLDQKENYKIKIIDEGGD